MLQFVTKLYHSRVALLVAYLLSVISLIPFARSLTTKCAFLFSGGWMLALGIVSAVPYLLYLRCYPSRPRVVLHLALLLASIGFYFFFVVAPSEWLHLPVYGVLWILLRRVFPFVPALLAGVTFGVFEELLQGLSPDRFFDPRDIVLNVVALVGGMAFIEPLRTQCKQQLNQ